MNWITRALAAWKRQREVPSGLPPDLRRAWLEVRRRRLTYLSAPKLASLVRLCRELESRAEGGIIVEAGCALGGSAIILCATKSRARPLFVYDVFETIPQPSDRDGPDVHQRYQVIAEGRSKGIGGDEYYGYRPNLYEVVQQNFSAVGYPPRDHEVRLVRGLLQDTLVGSEPVALAHIDVDWYEPVMTCLERLVPRLSPHGAIVLDDYRDWSGCRRAVDEYFSSIGRAAYRFDDSAGNLVVRRG